ncbi:hypothetical protein WAI453_006720 [Rhynchosporium graminicola]
MGCSFVECTWIHNQSQRAGAGAGASARTHLMTQHSIFVTSQFAPDRPIFHIHNNAMNRPLLRRLPYALRPLTLCRKLSLWKATIPNVKIGKDILSYHPVSSPTRNVYPDPDNIKIGLSTQHRNTRSKYNYMTLSEFLKDHAKPGKILVPENIHDETPCFLYKSMAKNSFGKLGPVKKQHSIHIYQQHISLPATTEYAALWTQRLYAALLSGRNVEVSVHCKFKNARIHRDPVTGTFATTMAENIHVRPDVLLSSMPEGTRMIIDPHADMLTKSCWVLGNSENITHKFAKVRKNAFAFKEWHDAEKREGRYRDWSSGQVVNNEKQVQKIIRTEKLYLPNVPRTQRKSPKSRRQILEVMRREEEETQTGRNTPEVEQIALRRLKNRIKNWPRDLRHPSTLGSTEHAEMLRLQMLAIDQQENIETSTGQSAVNNSNSSTRVNESGPARNASASTTATRKTLEPRAMEKNISTSPRRTAAVEQASSFRNITNRQQTTRPGAYPNIIWSPSKSVDVSEQGSRFNISRGSKTVKMTHRGRKRSQITVNTDSLFQKGHRQGGKWF